MSLYIGGDQDVQQVYGFIRQSRKIHDGGRRGRLWESQVKKPRAREDAFEQVR